jgi:hypothetical protein
MGGSVQFIGKEQIMQLFENKKIDVWSIFQYKQLIHKGTGEDDLNGFLDMLQAGGSNAVYTLKVYEGVTDPLMIKEKTDCDGSYNFKFENDRSGPGISAYTPRNQEILNRLEAIEQRLIDDPREDNEPDTIGSVIVDVIKDPAMALQWITILQGIFGKTNQAPPVAPLRSIEPVQAQVIGNITDDETDKLNRLEKALDILEKNDPKIIMHLEKLAEISTKKPGVFKNLLFMLETM